MTSLSDAVAADGVVTLREAIQAANTDAAVNEAPAGSGADVIDFDPGLFTAGPASITLNGLGLDVIDAVTVTGPGASLLTIDAQGAPAVFNVDNLNGGVVAVQFAGFTIAGGDSVDGGAVRNAENLTLASVAIRNNSADHGGGIRNVSGQLTVRDSSITGNTAGVSGGGIDVLGGTVQIVNSTVSGNSAVGDGGGINAPAGSVTVRNSTIAGNAAGRGGGVYAPATTTVRNAIIADNTAGSGPDAFGTILADYTLIESQPPGDLLVIGGNNLSGDPMLAWLSDGGAGTFVHTPLPGSPVIDAGDPTFDPNTFTPAMTFDQRGVSRVVDPGSGSGPRVDLGAVETTAAAASGMSITSLGFPVVFGEASTRFVILIEDDLAVDYTTLDNNDLRVTGPDGYDEPAAFVGADSPSNGVQRWAYYEVPVPGGDWNLGDDGLYTITINGNQIGDTQGHRISAGELRSFDLQFHALNYLFNDLGPATRRGVDVNESTQVAGFEIDGPDIQAMPPARSHAPSTALVFRPATI